jgi:hypothetical protein
MQSFVGHSEQDEEVKEASPDSAVYPALIYRALEQEPKWW